MNETSKAVILSEAKDLGTSAQGDSQFACARKE